MTGQLDLGFAELAEQQACAHLPNDRDACIAHFWRQILRHDAALRKGDAATVKAVDIEVHRLARAMEGGVAILGDDEASGYVLMRGTAAPAGTIPLWGQEGEFVLTIDAGGQRCDVRIEWDGFFGHGFSTHAVDWSQPFISETGYRSFLSYQMGLGDDCATDVYARGAIHHYLETECRGRLRAIQPDYRERQEARDAAAV